MSSGYPGGNHPPQQQFPGGPHQYPPYPNDEPGPPWIEMIPEQPGDRRRWRSLLGYVVVALVAAGVAVAVTLLVSDSGPSSPTVAPSGNALPGPNGGLNGGPQGGGQPSGGVATLLIAGRVSAVSSRSITLTGPQGAVTAAITDSTRISGSISRAADIDVGDVVSMQISQSGGKSTATSIQDPAQIR